MISDPEILALLASLPPPTELERQKQALDFAYGNLAASEHHTPSRAAFAGLARERYGWSDAIFTAWAVGRTWREHA